MPGVAFTIVGPIAARAMAAGAGLKHDFMTRWVAIAISGAPWDMPPGHYSPWYRRYLDAAVSCRQPCRLPSRPRLRIPRAFHTRSQRHYGHNTHLHSSHGDAMGCGWRRLWSFYCHIRRPAPDDEQHWWSSSYDASILAINMNIFAASRWCQLTPW